MSDSDSDGARDAPLNPALKSQRDETHDTGRRTPTPYDSASAKEGEGEGWPIVWLVVTIVCVVLAIYFIL